MGLIKGTANLTRFKVEGHPPEDMREKYPDKINRFAFRKLDDNSDQEQSSGWANIMDIFDSRFTWNEFSLEPYIALCWRIDKKSVPAKALQQYCMEAEEEIMKIENLEKLPKQKRKEIRDIVYSKLLRRAIPRTNTYDMVWDLNSSIVIFGGTAPKLCDAFSELFFKTFDLNLKTVFPYSLAYDFLEKEGIETALLDGLKPITFKKEN